MFFSSKEKKKNLSLRQPKIPEGINCDHVTEIQVSNKSKGSTFGMFYSISRTQLDFSIYQCLLVTGNREFSAGFICCVFWKLINPFCPLTATETCRAPLRSDQNKRCLAMQRSVYHFSGTDSVAILSRKIRKCSPGFQEQTLTFHVSLGASLQFKICHGLFVNREVYN